MFPPLQRAGSQGQRNSRNEQENGGHHQRDPKVARVNFHLPPLNSAAAPSRMRLAPFMLFIDLTLGHDVQQRAGVRDE